MRIRDIKKYGGSFCIHLLAEDMNYFKLKINDFVCIDDIVVKTQESLKDCTNCLNSFTESELSENGLCKECREVIE